MWWQANAGVEALANPATIFNVVSGVENMTGRAYTALRASGTPWHEACAVSALYLLAEMTGVAGFERGIVGKDTLTGEPLSAAQRFAAVGQSFLQFGGIGFSLWGLSEAYRGWAKSRQTAKPPLGPDVPVGVKRLEVFNRSCFVAGTPLLTPEGSRPIETLREGDWVLARSENDPAGPVEPRAVLRTFVRSAPVIELHIAGQMIETTAEHPFYVIGRGWVPAGLLEEGDRIPGHDGTDQAVDGVIETQRVATVYNVEVEEHHTYFVGCWEWGFSVWAHNADCAITISDGGVVQVWEVVGGKRTGKVLLTSTVQELEGAALNAANKGGLDLPALRKALAEHLDPRLNIPIRPTARELKVLQPSRAKEWNKAAEAIRNPTKSHGTDYRVRTYQEAEQLLKDAGLGELPFYEKNKTFGWDRYKRGYESHAAEPTGSAPQNNLPHIKWKTELGDGHIYFGE